MPSVLTHSPSSYSGSSSYRYIDRLLKRGNEIRIVSPYLDSYYATAIRRMARSKRFRILASSIDPDARKVLGRGFPVMGLALCFFTSTAASYLLYSLFQSVAYVIGVFILFLICLELSILFSTGSRNVQLKVPAEFIHAKMYIAEREAIVGSANLTYKGTHRNVEHIEIVHDQKRVDGLRRDFDRLWKAH